MVTTARRRLADTPHESDVWCLVNTKVSGWRRKWLIYIVTRPRGSEQTRPSAPPRPPEDSFFQTALWLVSMVTVVPISLFIVKSQLALIKVERRASSVMLVRRRWSRQLIPSQVAGPGSPWRQNYDYNWLHFIRVSGLINQTSWVSL